MSHSMSQAELDLVLRELEPLAGVQLQKIFQPGPHMVCLRLMRQWILLGVRPGSCRIHALGRRPEARGMDPPAFCMLLRKELLNSRLQRAVRIQGDRVVRLEFTGGILVVELLDRRANVILLDGSGKIRGGLRPLRPGLEQGEPYQAPPPRPDFESRPPRPWCTGSEALETYYEDLARQEVRTSLRRRVTRALKKARRTRRKVEADLARCQDADMYRKWADILMALQSTIPGKGRDSAQLPDLYEAGTQVTIPLDPRYDALGNAQRYYRKLRKLTAGLGHVEPRLEAAMELELDLEQLREELDSSKEGQVSEELLARVDRSCPVPRQQQRRGRAGAVARLPYRRFSSSRGLEILVGRGARDNHQLTFKVARGRDLWLHTRDMPGCHGVVRLDGKRSVDHATLLDAATLVAHFSKVKSGQVVEITHTLRKNVRPVPGAPGKVYVSDARTLRLELDPARLKSLLETG